MPVISHIISSKFTRQYVSENLVRIHIMLSLNEQTMQASFAKWNVPLWIRASSDVVINHNNTTNFLYYSFMYTYPL